MAKTGRPTKLTPDVQDTICGFLLTGAYLETAAAAAGIDQATLHAWMKRGARELQRRERYAQAKAEEKEADQQRKQKLRKTERERRAKASQKHRNLKLREDRFVQFHEAIQKALAEAELNDLSIIAQAAMGGAVIESRTVRHPDGRVEVFEKKQSPQWQAAGWKLERRFPKKYARTQRMEITGDEEKPVALTFKDAVLLARQKRIDREKANGKNGTHGAPLLGG